MEADPLVPETKSSKSKFDRNVETGLEGDFLARSWIQPLDFCVHIVTNAPVVS